jgi:hypothetical protein
VNSVEAVWKVAVAIIFSLGGGAALVITLSSWLGKIWANRIAATERARFAKDLEGYKSELQHLLEDRRDALSRKRDVYAKLVTSMRVLSAGLEPFLRMRNEPSSKLSTTHRCGLQKRSLRYWAAFLKSVCGLLINQQAFQTTSSRTHTANA